LDKKETAIAEVGVSWGLLACILFVLCAFYIFNKTPHYSFVSSV
jgi:hypothetical protein